MEKVSFFHADYRDSDVYIAGKRFLAGSFAVHLLNRYYKDDTAARLSAFKAYNLMLQGELQMGYLVECDFLQAGDEIMWILKTLPKLEPFGLLNDADEAVRVQDLFSKEKATRLSEYLVRRAAVTTSMFSNAIRMCVGAHPPEYNEEFFMQYEAVLQDVIQTLRFYDSLGEDLRIAFKNLRTFVGRADEAEHLNEKHLTPIAIEVFGQKPFAASVEYVPLKGDEENTATVARRMYFNNYYSFIVTDFFEGLHHGHYPRRCEVCGRFFLMTSARRQKYCDGNSPYKIKGKTVSCKDYGAYIKNKERAEDDPVVAVYKSLTSNIRVDKHRKNISPRFADAAKSLAEEYKQRAMADPAYAKEQYYLDMKQDALYAVVRRTVPQKEDDG